MQSTQSQLHPISSMVEDDCSEGLFFHPSRLDFFHMAGLARQPLSWARYQCVIFLSFAAIHNVAVFTRHRG